MNTKPQRGIITINTHGIENLALEGGKFVFKKEADEALFQLLRLQAFIESEIKRVKEAISIAGVSLDAGFKGVKGPKVNATYALRGEKFSYKLEFEEKLKELFLKEKKYYKVDSKKVEEYVEKEGKLPEGITAKERDKTLSLAVVDKSLLEAEI
jgi:hypothetical protein